MSAGGVFLDRELIQERTAKMLLEVRAVQFSASNPFFFTSGWASPVYIDCRKLISYPHLRQTVIDFATSTIIREIGVECVDGVAGPTAREVSPVIGVAASLHRNLIAIV